MLSVYGAKNKMPEKDDPSDWWAHFEALSLAGDDPRKITRAQFPVVMFFVYARQWRTKPRFSCKEVGDATGVSQSHAKHILQAMRRRNMVRSIGKNGVESLYELTSPRSGLPELATIESSTPALERIGAELCQGSTKFQKSAVF